MFQRLFFVCKGNDYITIFSTHCIGAAEFFSLDREVEKNYCATGNWIHRKPEIRNTWVSFVRILNISLYFSLYGHKCLLFNIKFVDIKF